MAKRNQIVFPNYHIPNEDRSLLLQPLDEILSEQGHLSLKKIAALYFTQITDKESLSHFRDQGIIIEGDTITIEPMLLSRRTTGDRSISRYMNTIRTLENIIVESKNANRDVTKEELGKTFYANALKTFANTFDVSPQLYQKLTGEIDSYKNRTVYLIESITLNHNSTVTLRVGTFIKKVREHLMQAISSGKTFYADPEIITLNARNLIKFQSSYATQLYLLIAKNQFYTNTLIIGIEELKKYLGMTENSDYRNFSKRLKSIIDDPGLVNSSCAILDQTIRGKKVKWLPAERDTNSKVIKIALKFKSNADLKHELLNSNLKFIRHINDGSLNEAMLVQIIARVSDDIIPEEWVNYCVNKAYEYLDRNPSKKNKYKGVGPLVWEYIKTNSFRTEFEINPDMCRVTEDPGLSIMRKRDQEIATQAAIPLSEVQEGESRPSVKDKTTWEYLKGLHIEDSFIRYAQQYISADYIQKKLRLSAQSGSKISVVHQVKKIVLTDFHTTFEQPIKSYARYIGFSAQKANVIYAMMDDELKSVLLGYVAEGKLAVPESWKDTFLKYFMNTLDSLSEVH